MIILKTIIAKAANISTTGNANKGIWKYRLLAELPRKNNKEHSKRMELQYRLKVKQK